MIARIAIACAIVLGAGTARAEVERYAVIVGDNLGAADEQKLRFAETDAVRVAELLSEVGGVRDENQVLLRGKSADQVRRALIATNERIRVAQREDRQTMLLVYYSGHGDADALHLGDTRLELRELEALVRGSPARVRILVIDACRSGSVTRVKGGTAAAPIALSSVDELSGEGVIVLTASTAGEDAQESDQLSGSFFTHYLMSGLRGAADDDDDKVVSVAEAFRYTREQTILASSRTLGGTQHPTFHYDLHGRADVVLADLGHSANRGQLTLPEGATWLVFRGDGAGVVAEITAGARRRTLSLSPGRYAVRGRERDGLLEGSVTVAAGRVTTVEPSKLEHTSYARLAHKGAPLRDIDRLFAGPSVVSPRDAVDFCGIAGWTHAWSDFTVSPRLLSCRARDRFDLIDNVAGAVDLGARVAKVWDLVPTSQGNRAGRWSSIDLGITAGVATFRDNRLGSGSTDPTVHYGAAWHVGFGFGMTWPIGDWLYLTSELGLERYAYLTPVGSAGSGEAHYTGSLLLALGTSL